MNRGALSLLGLVGGAAVVLLALLLVVLLGVRGELEQSRSELAELREDVARLRPASMSDISFRLADVENQIRDWIIAYSRSGPAPSGAGSTAADPEIIARLDELLEEIEALNRRVDQLCEGVPIC